MRVVSAFRMLTTIVQIPQQQTPVLHRLKNLALLPTNSPVLVSPSCIDPSSLTKCLPYYRAEILLSSSQSQQQCVTVSDHVIGTSVMCRVPGISSIQGWKRPNMVLEMERLGIGGNVRILPHSCQVLINAVHLLCIVCLGIDTSVVLHLTSEALHSSFLRGQKCDAIVVVLVGCCKCHIFVARWIQDDFDSSIEPSCSPCIPCLPSLPMQSMCLASAARMSLQSTC